jgi:predicted type IV restriction endonuclease
MINTWTSPAGAVAPPESVTPMWRTSTPPGANGLGPLHAALRQVAASIARLRADGGQVLEEDTKRILITPTIEALGWDHIAEIRNRYRHNRRDNPVDDALFLNRSPMLYVEAKPLGHSLDDRKRIVQTLNYANAAGVDWCVLTNGAEWRIYKVHALVDAEEKRFATATIDQPETLDDAARVLDLTDGDRVAFAESVRTKLMESETLRAQAAANTREQFVNSPNLREELLNAVISTMEAHGSMSRQALHSETIQAGLLSVLLGPGALWERLRCGEEGGEGAG